jgi:hypothetical protein
MGDTLFMNMKHVAASIAALTVLAGAPALALAQTADSQSPILLTANVQADSGRFDRYVPGVIGATFTNTSNIAATDVVFELSSNGAFVDRIEDVGTFAPGSTTRHTFSDVYAASNQKLTVAEVKFADGNVWRSHDATGTFGAAE